MDGEKLLFMCHRQFKENSSPKTCLGTLRVETTEATSKITTKACKPNEISIHIVVSIIKNMNLPKGTSLIQPTDTRKLKGI